MRASTEGLLSYTVGMVLALLVLVVDIPQRIRERARSFVDAAHNEFKRGGSHEPQRRN